MAHKPRTALRVLLPNPFLTVLKAKLGPSSFYPPSLRYRENCLFSLALTPYSLHISALYLSELIHKAVQNSNRLLLSLSHDIPRSPFDNCIHKNVQTTQDRRVDRTHHNVPHSPNCRLFLSGAQELSCGLLTSRR